MKLVINSEVVLLNGNNAKLNDDIVVERDDSLFGISGIILNNVPEVKDIPRLIADGTIQKRCKGVYVAWHYDKKNNKIVIANDLLSKQSVYYYHKDGLILVNTSLFDLCADLRANDRIPQINIDAVQYFCNKNVFCGDMTYESNTFFLTAYSYLVIDCQERQLEVKKLPVPTMKKRNEITVDVAVNKIEELFTEACKLQWQKNIQYGKEQLFTVSGGMDSRAVLLHMIKQNPNSPMMTYTYAQSGSGDEILAKRITKEHGLNNIFIPLDHCEFAYQRDEIIDSNEGQMFYMGSTGAILMAKMVQEESAGIIHTGLGGGEIMGDVCSLTDDAAWDQYSELTISQHKNLDDIRRCLNFEKTTSKYFHAFSPFLYEDFFEYVMCLPMSMRYHRKLYIEWYKRYMSSEFPTVMSHSAIMKGINKAKTKIYRALGKRNPSDMNPVQYWYDTQPKLQEYIMETWENDKKALAEHKELLEVLVKNYNEGIIKKFAVLTVTGSVLRMLGVKPTWQT